MRMVCWILLGLSMLLFLIGVYSKFAGVEGYVMGFVPVAWWRAAMALAIYSIAFKMVHGNGGT
jgi:hypothetical protein